MKFTGHSHTPQKRCSDSYWSFGPAMNNLLLNQTNIYWTLPHARQTLGILKDKGKVLGLVIDVNYSDRYYHKGVGIFVIL
jgi:hypothetical protein